MLFSHGALTDSLWGNQICFSRYSTLVTKELRLSLPLSFSMLENFKINMLSTSSFPHFFLSLPMSSNKTIIIGETRARQLWAQHTCKELNTRLLVSFVFALWDF